MVDQFVGGFTCSAITAAITCPLAVASTRILLDAGGGATNTEKVEVPQVVKELESKVEEIETQIAQRVESEIGKTQQAVQAIQKEVGTAIFAATNTPRSSTTTLNIKESLVPPPPPPPPLSPPPPLPPLLATETLNKESLTTESINKEIAKPIEEQDLQLGTRGGRLGTAMLRPEARPFLKTEALLAPGGAVGADADAGSLRGDDEDSEFLMPTLKGAIKGRAQYTELADLDGEYQKTILSMRSDAGNDSVPPAERARPRVGAGICIYFLKRSLLWWVFIVNLLGH